MVRDGLAVVQDDGSCEQLEEKGSSRVSLPFCQLFGEAPSRRLQKIPYYDILWCERLADEPETSVCVTFVHGGVLRTMHVKVDCSDAAAASATDSANTDYCGQILQLAYTNGLAGLAVYVLVNPHGGTGDARSIYRKQIEPVLMAANAKVTMVETTYMGHATDLMRNLDITQYDTVVCCSGDGIPYEVINGFYARPDRGVAAFDKIAVTQLPCGSGNALSFSTHGTDNAFDATVSMLKAQKTKLDLMAVSQGTGLNSTTKLSFLSQCYGMIADADIGTEHLRWLGSVRFELGVIQKVLLRATYPCDLWVDYATDTKEQVREHFDEHFMAAAKPLGLNTKALELKFGDLNSPPPALWVKLDELVANTVNQVYVGKLPYVSKGTQFFPAALPNDHSMDLVMTTSKTSLLEAISVFTAVEKGTHVHDTKVYHAKIRGYRLVPRISSKGHYISVDGESFPFEAYQVEVLPGVLTGLLTDSRFVPTSFAP